MITVFDGSLSHCSRDFGSKTISLPISPPRSFRRTTRTLRESSEKDGEHSSFDNEMTLRELYRNPKDLGPKHLAHFVGSTESQKPAVDSENPFYLLTFFSIDGGQAVLQKFRSSATIACRSPLTF